MRKLGVLLVASILLFVFGVGTFVYEFSQIRPHQMDLSQETQTMTTSMPNSARLYTKTYLSSVGDVRVVVDEMIEDDKLQDDVLVITYPKMLHIVQDDYEMSKDLQTLFNTFRTKSYDEYYAKNNEIHISIRYGKALKDKITLIDDYY